MSASAKREPPDHPAHDDVLAGRKQQRARQTIGEPQRENIEREAADIGHAPGGDRDAGGIGGEDRHDGEREIDPRSSGLGLQPGPQRYFAREPAERDEAGRGVANQDRGLIDRARKRRPERQRQAGRQGRRPGIIRLHRGRELHQERRPASRVEQPRDRDRSDAVEHEVRDLEIAGGGYVIEIVGREQRQERAGERDPARLHGRPATARGRGKAIDGAAERSQRSKAEDRFEAFARLPRQRRSQQQERHDPEASRRERAFALAQGRGEPQRRRRARRRRVRAARQSLRPEKSPRQHRRRQAERCARRAQRSHGR